MSGDLENQAVDVEEPVGGAPVTDADGGVVSTGGEGSYGAGAGATTAPPTAAEWQGVVDYARDQGVQLVGDDATALNQLLNAYRSGQQRNFYAEYGARMAPYADQISQWIQGQRAVQQQPMGRAPWQPPEWDPSWVSLVQYDQNTGQVYAKPGVNPAIAEKVMEYARWQDSFRENPAGMMQPLIEYRAREMIQSEFAQHRQTIEADNLISQNATWMFQQDNYGNPILHQDGSRALSPAGALYARAVNDIWNAGVRDVRMCHSMARGQVENAILRQQWLTQRQLAPASQAQQQQGQVPINVGGSATRSSVSPRRGPQSAEGLSLRDRLNRSLQGFNDEDANEI